MKRQFVIKDSHKLLTATLLSNVADGMHTLALGKYLYDHTGAVGSFALVLGFDYILGVLTQVYAGPVVDKVSARLVGMSAGLFRATVLLIIAALSGMQGQVALVTGLSILLKISSHFYRTSTFAIVPAVVPKEQQAGYAALSTTFLHVGQLIGVGLVGIMLIKMSTAAVFVSDALLFCVTAALFVSFNVPRPEFGKAKVLGLTQVVRDWYQTGVTLSKKRGLLSHILISTGDLAVMACINLTLVPIVNSRFGGNSVWLSILDGAFAGGAIFSFLFLKTYLRERYLPLFQVLQIASLTAVAFTHDRQVVLVAFFVLGVALGGSNALLSSKLFGRMPAEQRGRISGFRFLVISLVTAASVWATSMGLGVGEATGLGIVTALIAVYFSITVVLRRRNFDGETLLGAPIAVPEPMVEVTREPAKQKVG
ncbi:MFS transporter [Archangium sp.]|uniref:MFS transporter n=1 Tax=Archangium sp. TaxID=1872627 RepID=UPI002D29D87E|nr:MFS transporter [Archangium sp.]HYO56256.1 MFS transporter [Archangium sp.]